MSSPSTSKRRPTSQISMVRASRLYTLVRLLTDGPQRRDVLLAQLKMGLRTFYRELELLKKRGLKVHRDQRSYQLRGTLKEAETRLPFPDPHLSFTEMAELAALPGATSKRLAAMLESVIHPPASQPRARARKK